MRVGQLVQMLTNLIDMCLEAVMNNVHPETLTNICDSASTFTYPMQLIQITPFKL